MSDSGKMTLEQVRDSLRVMIGCRYLADAIDAHLAQGHVRVWEGWRETASRVLTVLDQATGDTDPNIDPDMTDDDIRHEYPEIWACQQLAGLLTAAPSCDDGGNGNG